MRNKVDKAIRTLIKNGVKTGDHSLFVIIGDKSLDQIVNLHCMLSKSGLGKSRPNVLWCYKDKLEFSSYKKKRAKQVTKLMHRGLVDHETVDPFSLYLKTVGIKFCQYKDSERILGNTFGMCILQDYEGFTPKLLTRTKETVEGGGLIILLIPSLSSHTGLYKKVMDVERHYLPYIYSNICLLLSVASSESCIVMDDELNILPISSHMKSLTPVVSIQQDSEGMLTFDGRRSDGRVMLYSTDGKWLSCSQGF